MLSADDNQRLTQVGPGTAMGNLMRRYWHPVGASSQLAEHPVVQTRLLGETLVLFRDGRGRLGLLAELCPHRGASLSLGQGQELGIRCASHGWVFDIGGSAVQGPDGAPPPQSLDDSTDNGRFSARSYPVEELGGLIFAYLGPLPAPLLPRYNVLAWDHARREANGSVINCNWLQVMENLLDAAHVEFLHGHYFAYVLERQTPGAAQEFWAQHAPPHMKRVAYSRFDLGIVQRHVYQTERDSSWTIGTPTFFPATSLTSAGDRGGSVIFVVPIDDQHTWFVLDMAERHSPGEPDQEQVPFFDIPGVEENGDFILGTANGQDHMAVVTQGTIANRAGERLGVSDQGIMLYRKMALEQIGRMERGDDPINVHRDPKRNQLLSAPRAKKSERH